MKQDFINYIKKEFSFSDTEIKNFENSLKKPLKKSLRVNTNKISVKDFKNLAIKNNWSLGETSLGNNTFYIDREDTAIALGNTLEHTAGFFYIQEVSASSSPYYMSGDKIDNGEYLILDTSASPGGKTTQLSEYYPNSIIIANEIDKTRMKSLFSNLDRMSSLNVITTNYDGRFFKNIDEIFDKILIDAPCSGEGTSFKTDDSLKYRNIKNIKKIARLQFGLVESSIQSLKVGGELVYSTCTLNTIENEEVIEKILEKYGEFVEIVKLTPETDFKRSWPHLNQTGGFFVAKLKKIKSIESKKNKLPVKQNLEKLTKNEQSIIEKFFLNNFDYSLKNKYLYKYKSEIFLSNKNINHIWDKLFLYKIGVNIGEVKDQEFIPSFYAGTFEKFKKGTIKVNEKQLNNLYKGNEIENINCDENKYYQLVCNNMEAGICKIKDNKIRSVIPSKLIRK